MFQANPDPHSNRSVPARRHCRPAVKALVILDMEPLLAKARRHCLDAAEELHKVTSELKLFSEVYEPAYSRWYYSRFGDQLTEIRNLENGLYELRDLVGQVKSEAFMMSVSEREAYERILAVRAGIAKIEELKKSASGFAYLDELPPEVEKMLAIAFEQVVGEPHLWSKQQYASMFENFKDNFRENIIEKEKAQHRSAKEEWQSKRKERKQKKSKENSAGSAASSRSDAARSKLKPQDPDEIQRKQIYRTLARRLHPDVNPSLTAHQRNLWHEVQAAYEARNLDRLVTLLAMTETDPETDPDGTENETSGFLGIRSVWRLKQVLKDFMKKIKVIQKELRRVQQEPAWNFTETLKDADHMAALAKELSLQVGGRLRLLKSEKYSLEQRIQSWSSYEEPARKRRTRSSAKARKQTGPQTVKMRT